MKQYFFPITIGLFLLAFVLLFALVTPQWQDWQSAKRELELRKAELKVRQEYFDSLKELSQKLGQEPEKMAKINSSVPSDPSFPSLLSFFQKEASQNNLTLKRIDFGPSVLVSEKPLLQKKTLYLELGGTYPNFKKLLSDMEKSSRLIQTESLQFSFPDKGDVFSFQLTVSVNFMPESALVE